MRPPERIDPMLEVPRRAWERNPDQRPGQFVANAGGDPCWRLGEDCRDVFEVEDDELWKGLERIAIGEIECETEGVGPSLAYLQLTAALAHPTRVHALTVVSRRAASPRELPDELGRPTRHVAYHIKRLTELGCVELVRIKAVRGGRVTKHIYRATRRGVLLCHLSQ